MKKPSKKTVLKIIYYTIGIILIVSLTLIGIKVPTLQSIASGIGYGWIALQLTDMLFILFMNRKNR